MLYREAGQFKTSYQKDAAIFPIRQDQIAIALVVAAAFVVVPLVATPYVFTGILIPFLILSLAALGLNILTGYAGQLSLGTAAFMAVGAFASYNFMLRVPGIPVLARVRRRRHRRRAGGNPVRLAQPPHPRLLSRGSRRSPRSSSSCGS
jgi:branched-chain amino acid transport system permease protein